MQKRTNWYILNLNKLRLGCLRVHVLHVINQKQSCTDGGNPTKKLNFWVTSVSCIFLKNRGRTYISENLRFRVFFWRTEVACIFRKTEVAFFSQKTEVACIFHKKQGCVLCISEIFFFSETISVFYFVKSTYPISIDIEWKLCCRFAAVWWTAKTIRRKYIYIYFFLSNNIFLTNIILLLMKYFIHQIFYIFYDYL